MCGCSVLTTVAQFGSCESPSSKSTFNAAEQEHLTPMKGTALPAFGRQADTTPTGYGSR
jgi:hypothetical protein